MTYELMADLDDSLPQAVPLALAGAGLATLTSTAALMVAGHRDTGHAVGPIDAVSHWAWGDRALFQNSIDARHTGLGLLTLGASSLLWGALYGWLRVERRDPGPLDAVTDAIAVSAVAATVDLAVVPDRITPGFEHRLSRGSLFATYGAFAAGLAIAGLLALRRR